MTASAKLARPAAEGEDTGFVRPEGRWRDCCGGVRAGSARVAPKSWFREETTGNLRSAFNNKPRLRGNPKHPQGAVHRDGEAVAIPLFVRERAALARSYPRRWVVAAPYAKRLSTVGGNSA